MDDRPINERDDYEDRRDFRNQRFRRNNMWWPILVVGLLLLGLWAFGAVANNPNLNLGNPPGIGQPGGGVGGGPENSPTNTPTPTLVEEDGPIFEQTPSTDSGGV